MPRRRCEPGRFALGRLMDPSSPRHARAAPSQATPGNRRGDMTGRIRLIARQQQLAPFNRRSPIWAFCVGTCRVEQRAAERRQIIADAERTVATEEAAAKDAVAAEDRLEAEVRDLEQRLTQARSDLAGARLRARRAEAAERRARQALDRLPRP